MKSLFLVLFFSFSTSLLFAQSSDADVTAKYGNKFSVKVLNDFKVD